MKRATIKIDPMPAPRMTRSDGWLDKDKKPRREVVRRYWEYRDEIKNQLNQEIKEPLTMGFVFYIPMPKSWSQKKKEAMWLTPHRQRPDLDNLIKAVKDSLLKEDSCVYMYPQAIKMWDYDGEIELEWE